MSPDGEVDRPVPQGYSERDLRGPAEPAPSRGPSGAARGLLMVLGVAALAVVVLLGAQATGVFPDFRNPFTKEQTNRSQPPLLKSIQDLSRYVAAEGNFQVVVDLQNDRKNVPEFLLNQRTLFVGAGSVQAYVDFGKIAEGALTVSPDGKSVEVKLPAPQLDQTNLDLEKSYVVSEQRGLLNRVNDLVKGDPNRQQQVYRMAEERITTAARDSGLQARAEENTRKMLEGLLRSLGYEKVTVTYTAP
ncbi:DUF4230 domain-containing protein [Micromonospora sp. DT233]|uniref:DUF4230 domain-containing protein n=1 Tax=Micromonospora sp. DT233 TaxID=3393432 RepID=UPI003CF12691